MGPPRCSQSYMSHTPQTSGSDQSVSPLSQQSSAGLNTTGTGMTPASRYQHNLKVLRRRDPSISSIFDQFSHVCLYHHNGTKWEKQGYEGSMFLYERESYPPYGFYILNRMGSEDHIQRLYPEDNIGAHGSYLIIRSYPEYTDRRLAGINASYDPETLNKFSNAYSIPNVEALSANQKGEATTIGLWMFTTDSREPLFDIFTRLHSYIKRNQPYPQEFRYGPDRPPPSIHASTPAATNRSHGPGQAHFQARYPSQTAGNGGLSNLDKLFAKMEPTPILSAAKPTTSTQHPTSSSNASIQSLFAGLHRQSVPTPSPPSSASTNTGHSLLDSIFASVSISNVGPSLSPLPIQAPAPTSTSAPQVLDQTTIAALLGHPPSRTASAASTAYSTDARSSHSSSREGDNEDDDDTSDWRGGTSDGYSESSTVLDPDAEYDDELQAAGASAGRPLLAEHIVNEHGHGRNGRGRMNGDVTPRPPVNGFISPPFGRQHRQTSASLLDSTSVAGKRHPHQQQQHQHQQHSELTPQPPLGSERVLVPFEPDSELWPYSQNNPTNNTNNNNNDSAPSDDEILELDFADTSALSDPDAFRVRPRTNGHGRAHTNGTTNGTEKPEKRVRTKRKQNRKERAAEQAREREEIERSWEMPVSNNNVGGTYNYNEDPPSPASPSPCPSPEPQPARNGGTLSGYGELRIINAAGLRKEGEKVPLDSTTTTPVKGGKAKAKASAAEKGKNEDPQGSNVTVARVGWEEGELLMKGAATLTPQFKRERIGEVVKNSLVNAVVGKGKAPGKVKTSLALERNDFVREVLTLIHVRVIGPLSFNVALIVFF
ncbi:hypothetical protein H0H87_009828 [Tephrocybe sp. NHM501043]|nr:hypothetical protein H0H87_009828 [Tephrocybe sp. NHM501043]